MTDSVSRDERIYAQIRHMVLCGESEETVFEALEGNGFTGDKAREMYGKARAERVAAIRRDCLQSLLWGLFFLGIGGTVSSPFLFGGEVPISLLALAVGSMCWGVYRIFKATHAFMDAPRKEGSLVEDS